MKTKRIRKQRTQERRKPGKVHPQYIWTLIENLLRAERDLRTLRDRFAEIDYVGTALSLAQALTNENVAADRAIKLFRDSR
jgi:hypothetical protein